MAKGALDDPILAHFRYALGEVYGARLERVVHRAITPERVGCRDSRVIERRARRCNAHRFGIANQASCGSATDLSVARVLAAHGCLAVLRATYEDATGALAVTVGIAVLPGPASASASLRALPPAAGGTLGIRPVPFAGTLAAQFGDSQRQLSSVSSAGSYLIMSTVGYADGRRRVQESADPYTKDEMLSVEHGIGNLVGSRLGSAPPPPHCPGAPGC